MTVIRVALDVPLPQLFDYAAAAAGEADIGSRVIVPFGTRSVVGIIVETAEDTTISPAKLRSAGPILDDMPRLTPEWLAFARFAATYYQHPLGEVIQVGR